MTVNRISSSNNRFSANNVQTSSAPFSFLKGAKRILTATKDLFRTNRQQTNQEPLYTQKNYAAIRTTSEMARDLSSIESL